MVSWVEDEDSNDHSNANDVPPNVYTLELMNQLGAINVDDDVEEQDDQEDEECLLEVGWVKPMPVLSRSILCEER